MVCILQDAKINRSIDRNMCINFEEMPRSCNFSGSYYGCFLTVNISVSLCWALKKKDYILILVYFNSEFWSLWLSGFIKAQAFSILGSFSCWFRTGTHDFSQDESQDPP